MNITEKLRQNHEQLSRILNNVNKRKTEKETQPIEKKDKPA